MLRRTVLAVSLMAALALSLPNVVLAQDDVRLDANTATAAELAAVPGLTADLADSIVAARPFPTIVEFDALLTKTMPEADAQKVYEHVFVPVNLNSAAPEEIALIPGMSQRMIREFLEYRPYADLGVFDREIGKYVDATEVARLRSYVTL